MSIDCDTYTLDIDFDSFDKGDEVRVVVQGRVTSKSPTGILIGRAYIARRYNSVVEFEVTSKAKPDWAPLRNGDVFLWDGEKRYVLGDVVFNVLGEECNPVGYYNNHLGTKHAEVELKFRE